MNRPVRTDAAELKQLNALLETALALTSAERSAWLRALPFEQQRLMPMLMSMLDRATVETDGFMRSSAHARLEVIADDAPGDAIGPYRLIGPLGHGGMSTVWLAERSDGLLQREVALKLPAPAGFSGAGMARRMTRERDILASLEHPRIARLYDAGVTAEGRPWLAMERVEGVPIDLHAAERKLSVEQRLRLFLDVADAVAHAHARLVVHRDLKPGNIFVTKSGDVRLLDFGVAQLLEDDTPADQQLTRHIGRPVTPDYAAPEQLGTQAVGTAADVYSLGIVLFELLTGQRPYNVSHHSATTLQDAVLHAPVPAVSSRAPDKATARRLRGDLDTIVAKALRKRPADRYTSVEAFAADVQRHLDGDAVLAQPPTWGYRARKFARRYRLPLIAAAMVLGSLLAGLGAALWQANEARAQAAQAEQSKRFIASTLRQAQPRQGSGGAVLAADLLVVAGSRIERELASDPQGAAELGVIIGEGLSMLGEPERGESILRAAVARATSAWGSRHGVTLRGRALLAESLAVRKPDEAAQVADALVPDALAGLPDTAEVATMALRQQSFQRARRDEVEASYAPLKQAIEIAERHLGPNHADTAATMGLLSNTYGRFGEYKMQLVTAQEALTRAMTGLGSQRPHLTLTAVERWYAEALRRNDRPADAVPILRRVQGDQRQLDGSDTPRVRNAIYQLGLALAEAGELGEALTLLRETMALEARQNNGDDNEDRRNFRASLAVVLGFARRADEALALMSNGAAGPGPLPESPTLGRMVNHLRYARLLALAGDSRAAARVAEEAAQRSDEAHAQYRAEALHIAAFNARMQRRNADALALAQQAWSDSGREKARPAIQASMAAELAAALIERGELARAEPLVQQSLALFEQAQVVPSARSATAWIVQARLHLLAGRADEAEATLRPLRAAWESTHPQSDWHGETLYWLARVQARRGDVQGQRALDHQAAALLRASPLPALRSLTP
jgi:eukaryotic-like serine/threonine-protein kinase